MEPCLLPAQRFRHRHKQYGKVSAGGRELVVNRGVGSCAAYISEMDTRWYTGGLGAGPVAPVI